MFVTRNMSSNYFHVYCELASQPLNVSICVCVCVHGDITPIYSTKVHLATLKISYLCCFKFSYGD